MTGNITTQQIILQRVEKPNREHKTSEVGNEYFTKVKDSDGNEFFIRSDEPLSLAKKQSINVIMTGQEYNSLPVMEITE